MLDHRLNHFCDLLAKDPGAEGNVDWLLPGRGIHDIRLAHLLQKFAGELFSVRWLHIEQHEQELVSAEADQHIGAALQQLAGGAGEGLECLVTHGVAVLVVDLL